MNDVVRYELREGVALVTVANPPVNALTPAVRHGLWDAVEAAEADPEVGAVVIQADGKTFPAGADVRDFQRAVEEPALSALCTRIEALSKPVIAAIHGTALGGGLELSLACHFRLALKGAQLGLPDVALGVVPTAGGTQRLTRVSGARAALDMLISGRPVTAQLAETLGIVDKVIGKNLARAAFGSARNMARAKTLPRPTSARNDGFRDPARYLEIVAARRDLLAGDQRAAVHKAIDLVEAALLLPFEAGLEMERVGFEDLVDSDQARGLRHAFLAERRTARVPEIRDAAARQLESVGIVGGGLMGAGIALACLAAGFPVILVEIDDAALSEARARIEAGLARAIDRRQLDRAGRDAQLARLTGATDFDALSDVDLVIEAVPEDLDTKSAVFAELGATAKPGAVLASTTSWIDLDALATAAARPEDVLGLHFFAPAHRMRLLEVITPARAGSELTATGIAFARRIGNVPLLSAAAEGYVANTLLEAYQTAADLMLEKGATPAAVDAAMRDYGFPLGLYQALDRSGLDAALSWRAQRDEARNPDDRHGEIADRMRGMGWLGRKSGRGYYIHDAEAGNSAPSPEVVSLIEALRREKHIVAREISDEEIRERCVLAMANAGARLVEAGVAMKPSDVDAAMTLGFGFPRWHGGPMEAADQFGLLTVRRKLRDWANEGAPEFWAPAPLFDELIKNGKGFDSLNG